MNLGNAIQVAYVGALITNASNTDSNSTILDMANWTGVIFATTITDCAATGVASLKIEQNTANSDSGMAALASSTATATSAQNDDLNGKLLVTGVHKPLERYVQAVRVSATANIAFGECIAILYGPRELPTADHSTIADSAFVVSAAEA